MQIYPSDQIVAARIAAEELRSPLYIDYVNSLCRQVEYPVCAQELQSEYERFARWKWSRAKFPERMRESVLTVCTDAQELNRTIGKVLDTPVDSPFNNSGLGFRFSISWTASAIFLAQLERIVVERGIMVENPLINAVHRDEHNYFQRTVSYQIGNHIQKKQLVYVTDEPQASRVNAFIGRFPRASNLNTQKQLLKAI